MIAVLRLINQKGLDTKCRSTGQELERVSKVLEALKRDLKGPNGPNSKEDQEAQRESSSRPKRCSSLPKKSTRKPYMSMM